MFDRFQRFAFQRHEKNKKNRDIRVRNLAAEYNLSG